MKKNPLIKHWAGLSLIWLTMLAMMCGCASRESKLRESARHYEYGLVYLGKEYWSQAYREFEKAAELAPENDSAHFCLGLSLYFQGKFEEAVLSYQKAIEINPQIPEYYNNIAAAYAKLGRWEDVIQYCRVALETPSYSTPGYAYYNIGSAYLNLGKTLEAVKFFNKSKSENPQNIDTHLQLGKAFLQLGNLQSAIEILNEAKSLGAKTSSKNLALQSEVEHYLGQSFLGLGDLVSAKKAFQSAIEKAPHSRLSEKSAKCLNDIQIDLMQ